MFYQALVDLIGDIPAGYEPVVYALCIPLFAILLLSALNVIGAVFKWIGGK
mgnify:CR=1 FL=1